MMQSHWLQTCKIDHKPTTCSLKLFEEKNKILKKEMRNQKSFFFFCNWIEAGRWERFALIFLKLDAFQFEEDEGDEKQTNGMRDRWKEGWDLEYESLNLWEMGIFCLSWIWKDEYSTSFSFCVKVYWHIAVVVARYELNIQVIKDPSFN